VLNDVLPTLFPEEKGEHKLSAMERRTKLHDVLVAVVNAVCAKVRSSLLALLVQRYKF
jgi:hypothetical protein